MYKLTIIFILCWSFVQPFPLNAQDSQKKIKGLNRRLFKFRQEFLELKEQVKDKESLQKAQQEQFDLQAADLAKKNQDLINQVESLRMQVEKFEEQLALSATTQLTSDLTNLRKLVQILVLKSLNETQVVDEVLLEIINTPESVVPRDLLLLFIAELMQHNEEWEQSLGYYGILLSEFPDSPYYFKTIYEMSEIFGQLDQTEEQRTLLLQLLYAETDVYTQLAKEKLDSLGEQTEQVAEPETTPSLDQQENTQEPENLDQKAEESPEQVAEPETTPPLDQQENTQEPENLDQKVEESPEQVTEPETTPPLDQQENAQEPENLDQKAEESPEQVTEPETTPPLDQQENAQEPENLDQKAEESPGQVTEPETTPPLDQQESTSQVSEGPLNNTSLSNQEKDLESEATPKKDPAPE